MNRFLKCSFLVLSGLGILISVYQIFHLSVYTGYAFVARGYYFLIYTAYLPLVFLAYPAKKGKVGARDIIFAVITFIACFYLYLNAYPMQMWGWESLAPVHALVASAILMVLLFIAGWRGSGLPFAIICVAFAFFPLYTEFLPSFLNGVPFKLSKIISLHIMGTESILGVPMRVFAESLIGFIIFGVALMSWGGGAFFSNLALAMLGHMRGGPAKVSVVASCFFGSMSGSVISNVVTTGSMTIPAMKKSGYPAYYAAAIETCASTGGCFMPPIMGATAFVMASFLGIEYYKICIAAFIPAVLFYVGLFAQADAYAAKMKLVGLPRDQLPSLWQTLKSGWFYIFAFLLLVYLLVFERLEVWAPYYTTVVLFVLCMLKKETRLTTKDILRFIEETGKILSQLCAILGAVGFIIGSLSITGVAHSFASEIIALAGGNAILLLLLGAICSIFLGMGMTVTACYVFLAIVLAPALVKIGFYPLSVHLFVMYCGIISFITPPVAVGAYAAAGIAGSSPMKTGFQSMRLGMAIYFLPFFFVLNPSLIMHGPPLDIIISTLTCALGIMLIAGSIEGYVLIIGNIGYALRLLFIISGSMLGIPEWRTDIIGAVIAVITILGWYYLKKKKGSP